MRVHSIRCRYKQHCFKLIIRGRFDVYNSSYGIHKADIFYRKVAFWKYRNLFGYSLRCSENIMILQILPQEEWHVGIITAVNRDKKRRSIFCRASLKSLPFQPCDWETEHKVWAFIRQDLQVKSSPASASCSPVFRYTRFPPPGIRRFHIRIFADWRKSS